MMSFDHQRIQNSSPVSGPHQVSHVVLIKMSYSSGFYDVVLIVVFPCAFSFNVILVFAKKIKIVGNA